jgi:restriction endonuclease S subunit
VISAQLPSNWAKVKLGEVAENLDAQRVPLKKSDREERDGLYPYYGASGVIDSLDDYIYDGEYLLVAEDGANLLARSTPIAFRANGQFWVNNHAHVLSFNGKADLHFLEHYLSIVDLEPYVTGSAQPKLNRKNLERIPIPLPPLSEQKRIAAILDRADAIRRKRQEAIKLTEQLLRSVFLDMFGDPVTNPKGWPIKTLDKLVTFRTGKLDSNASVEGGKYPFFTCSRDAFWIDEAAFDCEALLLAGNNASADYSVKLYKGKFNAYQRTYVITLIDVANSYEFMRFALDMKLNDLKRLSKGTNTKYLTLGILNEVTFQVPSIEAQKQFDAICERTSKSVRAFNDSSANLENLFNSLVQRAFRGEL